MKVLGVDPGTRVLGYGLLLAEGRDGARTRALGSGIVRAEAARRSVGDRLSRIYRGVREIIAEGRPDAVAIEESFVWKNVRSALRLGEGRAAAILAATEAGVRVHEYAPSVIKRAVTGHGGATKRQVQEMVRRLLALPCIPEPEDASDALAAAF